MTLGLLLFGASVTSSCVPDPGRTDHYEVTIDAKKASTLSSGAVVVLVGVTSADEIRKLQAASGMHTMILSKGTIIDIEAAKAIAGCSFDGLTIEAGATIESEAIQFLSSKAGEFVVGFLYPVSPALSDLKKFAALAGVTQLVVNIDSYSSAELTQLAESLPIINHRRVFSTISVKDRSVEPWVAEIQNRGWEIIMAQRGPTLD